MMMPMILRTVCMSKRAARSHHKQCAVDQRHKPNDPYSVPEDRKTYYESRHVDSSLYDTPDSLSTDACSPMLQ